MPGAAKPARYTASDGRSSVLLIPERSIQRGPGSRHPARGTVLCRVLWA